jgi:hypothetical protein
MRLYDYDNECDSDSACYGGRGRGAQFSQYSTASAKAVSSLLAQARTANFRIKINIYR